MLFNRQKLRAIFVENGDNDGVVAELLGIAPQTFSSKINEKKGAAFTYPELCKIIEHYKISKDSIYEIFFENKVS